MTEFDQYEKEYIERIKKGENLDPKQLYKTLKKLEEELEPLDYVILGLMRNGISHGLTFQNRLRKVSFRKITKSVNKLEKLGMLVEDKSSLWKRITNWEVSLTDKGSQTIEKKIDELKDEWDKLVLLYEKKDKEKLREGMISNRMNFPLMMMMGLTSGMMMGSMLGMNHMMMGDFMAEVDYAYDMGYADGAGFGDGAMPAEGGDFGGDGGGFMDGGMAVGF